MRPANFHILSAPTSARRTTSSAFGGRSFHWKARSSATVPNEDAITRLSGAILAEQNDESALQRARFMTLEFAPMSDNVTVKLHAVAARKIRPYPPDTA